MIKTTMTLALSTALFTGCGGGSDDVAANTQDNTTQAPSTNTKTLEARSISILEDGKKVFYGECKYKDGQAAPMLIKINTPEADFDIAIVYFEYLSGTRSVFSMPSRRGDIFYNVNDQTIQLETIDISLNGTGTGYTGRIDDGRSVYDCAVTLGLEAKTYADLEALSK